MKNKDITKIVVVTMVKNESKIICRLLSSILETFEKLSKNFCLTGISILDTGSTDNTPIIAKNFLISKNIDFVIEIESFVDFGYSRSRSYEVAYNKFKTSCDYYMLLDGDMVLQCDLNYQYEKIDKDYYTFEQCAMREDQFSRNQARSIYTNNRLLSSKYRWICVCKTHEFWIPYYLKDNSISLKNLKCSCQYSSEEIFHKDLTKSLLKVFWIKDLEDGGSKSDKHERDIRLLDSELALHYTHCPIYSRALYYNARANASTQKLNTAVDLYKKRLNLPIEFHYGETYLSYIELGTCYKTEYEIARDAFVMINLMIDGGISTIHEFNDFNQKFLENNGKFIDNPNNKNDLLNNFICDKILNNFSISRYKHVIRIINQPYFPKYYNKFLCGSDYLIDFKDCISDYASELLFRAIKYYFYASSISPNRNEHLFAVFDVLDNLAWETKIIDPDFSNQLYKFCIKIMDVAKNKKENTEELFEEHDKYKESTILKKSYLCAINMKDKEISSQILNKMIKNNFNETDKFTEDNLVTYRLYYNNTFGNPNSNISSENIIPYFPNFTEIF